MHIEFEPGRMTLEEARGVVAMLVALHGRDVLVTSNTVVTVELDASKAVEAIREEVAKFDVVQDALGGNDDEVTHGNPAEAFGAPQAAASTAVSAPTPPVTSSVETVSSSASAVDSAGFPWDERIHSSSRATNQDGTWRYRKGIGNDVKAAVEAELRGQPASPPAPAPAVPVAPQPPSSAPTPSPAPPVSPPAAPVTGLPPFPAFMTRMAPLAQAGKTSLTRIAEIAATLGVTTLPELAQQSHLIPTLEAMVMAEVGA